MYGTISPPPDASSRNIGNLNSTTAKFMWNDFILSNEGPSNTRDTKIAALRLKFKAFKALEGEKVKETFTKLKILLNELENKGVKIPQAEVNGTFVISLPKKWLSVNQTQRANNSIKNDSLASLYGKYNYEKELTDHIYESETQRFTIQSSTSKDLISNTCPSTSSQSKEILLELWKSWVSQKVNGQVQMIENGAKTSSGSTTSKSDHSIPNYEAFCFEEKSSGSTTSHSDPSLIEYESFHFDLSIDQLPSANRSDSHREEFADELAHIISSAEDKDKGFDPGIFIINRVHSKRFSILLLDDFSSILFVRDFIFLTDPSEIETFLSFPSENEDKVFDLGIILSNGIFSFMRKSPHLPIDNFMIDNCHIL
ncbi:hypothetical protein Tco_0200519 [Tanacetum coccineum]